MNKQSEKGKACQTRKAWQENMTEEREIDLLIRRVRDFMLRNIMDEAQVRISMQQLVEYL